MPEQERCSQRGAKLQRKASSSFRICLSCCSHHAFEAYSRMAEVCFECQECHIRCKSIIRDCNIQTPYSTSKPRNQNGKNILSCIGNHRHPNDRLRDQRSSDPPRRMRSVRCDGRNPSSIQWRSYQCLHWRRWRFSRKCSDRELQARGWHHRDHLHQVKPVRI